MLPLPLLPFPPLPLPTKIPATRSGAPARPPAGAYPTRQTWTVPAEQPVATASAELAPDDEEAEAEAEEAQSSLAAPAAA